MHIQIYQIAGSAIYNLYQFPQYFPQYQPFCHCFHIENATIFFEYLWDASELDDQTLGICYKSKPNTYYIDR